MNKKLSIVSILLPAMMAQAKWQETSAPIAPADQRQYSFKSLVNYPVTIQIRQTAGINGKPRPGMSFELKPNMSHSIQTNYTIESLTVKNNASGKSYTWRSVMTGKVSPENALDWEERKYYGYGEKLDRGGMYEITAENDESKFDNANNKL